MCVCVCVCVGGGGGGGGRVIHVPCLNFKAWYVTISECSCAIGISISHHYVYADLDLVK